MQLRHLRTFAAVAAEPNVTRAAAAIHLAQSSVTEQIQALEADLGVALFDRSRRRLGLTPAGKALLDYAGQLLALTQEARAAVAAAAGHTGGTLVVGALETLAASRVPPLLAALGAANPTLRLQLRVAGSGTLRAGVGHGDIDLALLFGTAPDDDVLQSEVLGEEPLVLIVPRAHRLAGSAGAAAEDLAGEACLVTEPGCVYRNMFDDAFAAAGAGRPRLAGEVGSIAAVRRLVAAGLGCALVPCLAVPPSDDVALVPWRGADTVAVRMLWRRRRVQAPALRLALDEARRQFAAGRDGAASLKPAGDRPRHAARSR